jgi:GNAT superfamily N-acetyltransferase
LSSLVDLREERIARTHDRTNFDCGEPALNDYLARHARQNDKGSVSRTYVMIGTANPAKVLGYYTLSPISVDAARVPERARPGSGRYDVAGFLLGRLAVDLSLQGQGLGGQLMFAAARRCVRAAEDVGGTALMIDAKNERACDWYRAYGAVTLIDSPLSLVLPLSEVANWLAKNSKP